MTLTPQAKKRLTKEVRNRNIRAAGGDPEKILKESKEKKEKKSTISDKSREKIELAVYSRRRKSRPKIDDSIKKPFLVLTPMNPEDMLVTPEFKLVEVLKKSYLDEAKRGRSLRHRGDKGQKNLYMSNIKACPRELFYKFYEPERAREYTAKGLILFDDGNRHHENLQRRLEDERVILNPEGFLELPEFEAAGYYDGLSIVGERDGWLEVEILEIKSKLPYACNSVYQADYDQAQIYIMSAQLSRRLKTKKIRVIGARLLYKDRAVETDDVHFEWAVRPDRERQQQIIKYFRFLKNEVIDGKTLAPHPYERSSQKCFYCLFSEWCWKDHPQAVIEYDAGEEPLPEQEIIDGYLKKFHELLKEEEKIKEQKKEIEPILIYFFLKTKAPYYPVNEFEAIAPKQGSKTEWDIDGLTKAVTAEFFKYLLRPKTKWEVADVIREIKAVALERLGGDLDQSKITELMHTEYIPATTFDQFKTIKKNKPSISLKKIRGESAKNELVLKYEKDSEGNETPVAYLKNIETGALKKLEGPNAD